MQELHMFEVLLLADPIPFHTFFHSDHSDWTGKESASILTTAECQEISRLQSCICAMKNDSKSLGLEKVCTLKSIGIHWFIVVYPGFMKNGSFLWLHPRALLPRSHPAGWPWNLQAGTLT